jgi:starch phosphorylase
MAEAAAPARKLVEMRKRLESVWPAVHVSAPVANCDLSTLHVGDRFTISAIAILGELSPSEVDVEVCYGTVDSNGEIRDPVFEIISESGENGGGSHKYHHEIECQDSGRYGFTVRVTPAGDVWRHAVPGFVTWSD